MQQTVLWIFVCSCFLARCEKFCPKGRHGVNCTSLCHCQNGGTCDPATGDCMCTAGWMGLVCGNRCPSGTYGTNCNFECDCNNEQQCDHINGSCICAPGYIGEKCQGTCPPGKYGPNCIGECHCESGAMCDVVKGECFCSPGYRGKNCGEPCPSGYYGKDCANRCNCINEAMCDGVTGKCFCLPGDEKRVPEVREVKLGEALLIIGGILLVILVATILVIALKYYRRRVQSLKMEICNIHHTADPEESDRNHFDNPLYFFCSTIRDVKNLNLDKEKKECYGVDTGFLNGSPGNSILLKNKEADHANPNVYHTEDNLLDKEDKDEHVYEELKDSAQNLPGSPGNSILLKNKEADHTYINVCYKEESRLGKDEHVYEELKDSIQNLPEETYDHLDYNRPGSSLKTHYHQMLKGIKKHQVTAAPRKLEDINAQIEIVVSTRMNIACPSS